MSGADVLGDPTRLLPGRNSAPGLTARSGGSIPPAAALFDATAMPPPRWNAGSEPRAWTRTGKGPPVGHFKSGRGIPPLPQSRSIIVTMQGTTQVGVKAAREGLANCASFLQKQFERSHVPSIGSPPISDEWRGHRSNNWHRESEPCSGGTFSEGGRAAARRLYADRADRFWGNGLPYSMQGVYRTAPRKSNRKAWRQ
jgi:hypothetical protein